MTSTEPPTSSPEAPAEPPPADRLGHATATIEELLRERSQLDALLEQQFRRQVTVLFSDIQGSTAYFERWGDLGGRQMVRRHHDLLFPLITQQQGTVIKTFGDAIMASFTDPAGGVQAAMAMQRALRDLNRDQEAAEQIHIRIGLNSGLALVEPQDVFGDVVNAAAHVQACALPDQILISAATYRQLPATIRCRLIGAREVKGKSAPIELFEVCWEDSPRELVPSPAAMPDASHAGDQSHQPVVPEDIAHHASRGEVWDKAVAYYRQAADQAAGNAAYRQAVVHFEQALTSIRSLPGNDDTHRLTIDLQLDLSNALAALGELTRASDFLQEAAALAETLDDGRRLGRACALLTFSHWLGGNYPRANTAGRRAMAIAEILDDCTCRAGARLVLGQVYLALGDYAHAQDCFKQNIASLEGELRHDLMGMPGHPAVLSRAWLGWSLAESGAFAAGQAYAEEALRMAEGANHRFSLAAACYGAGVVLLYRGDYVQATHPLERGLSLCQSKDLSIWFPWIAACLGAAYAECGRVATALPLLEQAVERADHLGLMAYQARGLVWLGEAYCLAGRLAEALGCADRALTLARELQEPSSEGQALWLHAEIAAHRLPPEREAAEAAYRQAQVLAEAFGMRPLLARCHFGLGTVYRTLDQRQPAHRELSRAAELFRTMDMTFWLSRTEATLTCGV
jgi:class 3 adenylate cyclase